MFEAFQIGPFLFRSYTLLLLIGIWLGVELFLRLAASEGLRVALFLKKAPWFLVAFLIGGRLLAILLLYRAYMQDSTRILIFWDGEFNVVGGFVGIVIMLYIFTRSQHSTFLRWIDALIPAFALILAFDWLGRFFGALSYGKPTDVAWGVVMESMSVRYTVPIHPVQLYYALSLFGLTFLLLLLEKRKKGKDGQRKVKASSVSGVTTLLGIILASIGVIILEFMRGDFAITVFAKLSDFFFLTLLFVSLGFIAAYERRISLRYSMINSILVGLCTMAYLLLRPLITVASVEWRFSQFLAVLAILATSVYVVAHRWKYSHH